MIVFACPRCSTSYYVGRDKAGKRTKCAKCQEPLLVPNLPVVAPAVEAAPPVVTDPPTEPDLGVWQEPPLAKVYSVPPAVVAMIPLGCMLIFVAYLLVYSTSKSDVEGRLRRNLPPHEKVEDVTYDTKDGGLRFRVKCQNYGDPLGSTFDVSYLPRSVIDGARVSNISVTRFDLSRGGFIKLVEYTFRDGKITTRKVIGAQADEGVWLESTATQLDAAARATL